MFIRLLQSVEKECDQYAILDPKKSRSSRSIAKWYYDQGNVVSYEMFHGRSAGKIAQRTTYHDLRPKRKELPPFGNWNQQLVGIAYVVTPKK
jgi:hypothetical protein